MSESVQLPDVFAYNNYRIYLKDYQEARFRVEPSFSKSEFSRLLRLPNTRSYLTDVFHGKPVTSEFVERFIEVLKLDKNEANYFRVLVKHNQCENPDERTLYFEQLIALNRTPRKFLNPDVFTYYKYWYNSVIRALLGFYNFKDDFSALSKKVNPPITVREVKRSITLLQKLNLITPDKDGYLRPTDKSISTPDFIKDELIRQYQIQLFELAKKSISQTDNTDSQYYTNTISISKQTLPVLRRCIERFRAEIRSLAVKDEWQAEQVFTICLGLLATSSMEKKHE